MNSKLFPVIVIGLFSLTLNTLCAQVAINNSATNPDPSAILDLNSGNTGVNKGFLAPQVSLTNVTVTALQRVLSFTVLPHQVVATERDTIIGTVQHGVL